MRNDRPPGSQRPAGEPNYNRPAQQPSYQQRQPANTVTPATRTPEMQRSAQTQTEKAPQHERGNDRPAAKGHEKRENKRPDR